MLTLKAFAIRDTLGARLIEGALGKRITIISGQNGSGKTTIIEGLRRALLGGKDLGRLVNVHVDEPDPGVLIRAEDQTGRAYELRRVPGEMEATRQVLGKDGGLTAAVEPVPGAVAWLRGLLPSTTLDVGALLTAKLEDLATLIQLACPLKMERAALLKKTGLRADELPTIPDRLHPLEELHLIREHLDKVTRRSINRDKDMAEKGQRDLEGQIVLPIQESQAQEIARLEGEAAKLHSEMGRMLAAADGAEELAITAAKHAHDLEEQRLQGEFAARSKARRAMTDAETATVRAEAERRIAEIRAEVERAIAESKGRADIDVDTARQQIEAQLDANDEAAEKARVAAGLDRTKAAEAIEVVKQRQAAARERLVQLRAEEEGGALKRSLRKMADGHAADVKRLAAESARLTQALAALDAFRRGLAKDLPIPGLSIETEGKAKAIKVNDEPWDQINEAQRLALLVRLCALSVGDAQLPIVFLDKAESVVGENWPALLRELVRANVQAVVCRAEPHPLTVTPIDDEAQLAAFLAPQPESVTA